MATGALGLAAVLIGCAVQGPDQNEPSVASEPPSAGGGLTIAPSLDPSSGLWLSDGWPVPDPSATFDPTAPWISAEDASLLIVSCMESKGWAPEVTSPGAFSLVVPPEQRPIYLTDLKSCYMEHRIGIDPSPPLTPALAQREYDAQVRTRDCLAALGLQVPELPSYQVFEDALLSEGSVLGVYEFAHEAGLDLTKNPTAFRTCPDPLDSWGHN